MIQTSVLKTLLCFQLLDHLEEQYDFKDVSAIKVVDTFFDKKNFTYKDVAPLMSLQTTIGLLASVVFFVKVTDQELDDKVKSHINYFVNGRAKVVTTNQVMRVIRNSIAHWSDGEKIDGQLQIYTKNDKLIFTSKAASKKYKVTINFPEGFHLFVMNIIRICRKKVSNQLSDGANN